MQVFVVAVSVALIVSFMCSIFESVLLSLTHAQVEVLAESGQNLGAHSQEHSKSGSISRFQRF